MKSPKNRLHSVMVVGATPAGVAAASKLGQLGIPVTLVETQADLNQKLGDETYRLDSGVPLNFAHRPALIRILRNPGIRCLMPAAIQSTRHSQQGFTVSVECQPTFVNRARCTLCSRCVEICPAADGDGQRPVTINSRLSLPGQAVIDKRRQPLCQANCPLGVNAQGYIALVKAGRYQQALKLIRKDNVLPGICGRICTHPCESACRREDLDGPLAIRDIKRFVADFARKAGPVKAKAPQVTRQERVAVIGGGPAGLAAAADLARHGLKVTLFEKEKAAGGLLRYGIGPHRLPRRILEDELETIAAEGVEILTNRPIRIPQDLPELQITYQAVILAIGSWADRRLEVPGEDLEGVEGCLAYLTRYYRDPSQPFAAKAAVIGDGNAAFDLARVLQRQGAQVTIVSWFAKEAIPADPEEVKAALDEGIIIKDQSQVVAFNGTNGRLQGLRLKPTRPGPEDANGIAWPEIIPDSRSFDLDFAHAFVAIGQTGAYTAGFSQAGPAVSPRGLILVNDYGRTSLPGVYAAGDAANGATSVVQAMAGGRQAAASVIHDLDAAPQVPIRPLTARPADRDFNPIPADQPRRPRTVMPEIALSQRLAGFKEVALGFDEAQSRSEAARCLQCGGCAQCLECLEACGTIQALHHDEQPEKLTENVGVLILADPDNAPRIRGEDVIRAYGPTAAKPDVQAMILRGFAAAARATVVLREGATRLKGHGVSFVPPDPGLAKQVRIGVFACRCNESFGWSEEMSAYLDSLTGQRKVVHVETLTSACIPEGIGHIISQVREKGLTRVVLASCVCCPLNFICSACTDQRSRLKYGLFGGTGISRSMVQTCNLRGEVLRRLESKPEEALELFKGLIQRSIGRAEKLMPFPAPARSYNFATAVIGQTEAALHSALTLAEAGLEVFMFGTQKNPLADGPLHPNIHLFEGSEVIAVSGSLGNFQVLVRFQESDRTFSVGGVILGEKSRNMALFRSQGDLPGTTVQSAMQRENVLGIPFMLPGTTSISGLFLADPPGIQISKRTKGEAAAVLAAAIMPRGPRQNRGFSVVINEGLCRGCGRCLKACPYQAVALQPNEAGGFNAVVDDALCKGCGNCISVCPSNAADSPFRDQVYLEQTLEELLAARPHENEREAMN